MLLNILNPSCRIFLLLVQVPHNKMALLNVSIAICWMLLVRYYLTCMSQRRTELMLSLLPYILLIVCHHSFLPISLLFPLTPRVFGCATFVHLLGPGCDKLAPQAGKCRFLGYSRTEKDYCYYDPVSHQYYTCHLFLVFSFYPDSGNSFTPDLIFSSGGDSPAQPT